MFTAFGATKTHQFHEIARTYAFSNRRPDIRLPKVQTQLIQRIAKVNSKIVLVLLHGGIVGLDDVLEHVESIVSTGYPGRYASTILPEALLGGRDRGWGKTPVTWYKNSFSDEFNMLDYDMGRFPGRTYRYHTGQSNFRFGFGLNPLTTFGLRELKVLPRNCFYRNVKLQNPEGKSQSRKCSDLRLFVSVSNTGHRAADEVVMAYFIPLDIPGTEPASKLREQLFGFERIHLQSGESRKVSFSVQVNNTLVLATSLGKPVTFPGRYTLRIGNGVEFLDRNLTVGDDGLFHVGSQTDGAIVVAE
jgi:beta-glucosidase